jgi:hypothetical protein
MIQNGITWFLTVTTETAAEGDAEARSSLEEHLDQVMDELMRLEGCRDDVHDPGLSADFSGFPSVVVEVELLVDHDEDVEALRIGDSVLRSAVHAAGGYTPRWGEQYKGGARYEQRKVQLEPA